MPDACPHCGSRLPPSADAFCPECRNALAEPPAVPASPRQQRATRESGTATTFRVLGWLLLAGAVFTALTQSGLDAALGEAARRSARARRLELDAAAGESGTPDAAPGTSSGTDTAGR